MGVLLTIATVLVVWCVLALGVGVLVGRAIALRPREGLAEADRRPVHPARGPSQGPPPGPSLSVSYRERT